MSSKLLVVDDETALAEVLKRVLSREGHEVDLAPSAETALKMLEEGLYDLVLADILLTGMDGVELLERIRARSPDQAVVVMTANPTLDSAVRALRAGAFDYMIKPVINDELKRTVRNALQLRALRGENEILRREVEQRWDLGHIVGQSPAIQEVLDEMGRVAEGRSNVLLLGETGTGKELFARALHARSPRREKPFVPINCSAIPENLMESELFGFQRGAFTGAVGAKRGLLEEADGGTVFLDEIGEMNHHLQSKLLRVIDDRQIRPLGAVQSRLVDIRFVAATNLDLARAISSGGFREDLYYRLAVITLSLPALQRRAGDVPRIARHFLERFAREFGRPVTAIEPEAMALLEAHSWPGNVRELQNVIERAVLIAGGPTVTAGDLPVGLRGGQAPAARGPGRAGPGGTPVLSIEGYTRDLILRNQADRSEQEIADLLGITRKALWEKRKRWGLKRA